MGEEFPWSEDVPNPFSCLWEEKNLLKAIQEAQSISLILEMRSKQNQVRESLRISPSS